MRYLILSASFIVTKEGSIGRWPALTHFPASTPLASGIIYASTLLGEASKEAPGTSDRCVNFRISLHNFEQTTPHYLIDNNVCFIHTIKYKLVGKKFPTFCCPRRGQLPLPVLHFTATASKNMTKCCVRATDPLHKTKCQVHPKRQEM